MRAGGVVFAMLCLVVTVLAVLALSVVWLAFLLSPYTLNMFLGFIPLGLFVAFLVLLWGFSNKRVRSACLIAALALVVAGAADYRFETRGLMGDRTQVEGSTFVPTENIEYGDYLPFRSSLIARLSGRASLSFAATDDLPKIDSASALLPVASAFVTATYPEEATTIAYDYACLPEACSESQPISGDYPDPKSCVFQYNNSSGGFHALADGLTDVFLGAKPSDEQTAYAAARGVEFECTPIGREAFVFFVNGGNPVEGLSVDEIKGIYSGRIGNWREVGGADSPILAFQRNKDSGSQSQMIRFMADTPLSAAPEHLYSGSMGGIVRAIADYDNGIDAIGYSFRYYATDLVGEYNIKLLAVDGVQPSTRSIEDGSYPLTSEFYAVTRKGDDSATLARLLEWMRSEEGQTLVELSGYSRLGS